ncbi:MAG: GGDEF domain-containing protein [Lachnospiraceae bacterium]|nr:GGDEF domain-containing protein [Lachnospiraceae bacterium]
MNKIKKSILDLPTLEEKIFVIVCNIGFVIALASSIITLFEGLGKVATISSFIATFFMLFIVMVYKKFNNERLARLMLCYFLNCIFIPFSFFSCGGIDSGMPLYIIASLFVIMPVLKGKERIVCFFVSLVVNVCAIGISYNGMVGTKAKTLINISFMPKLSLESRILDVIFSVLMVSLFIGFTTITILNAHEHERQEKSLLYERFEEMSKRDALTGTYNRRELYKFEDKIKNSDEIYYISMMDIDFFKAVNDKYGHLVGDKVLIDVTKEMKLVAPEDNDEFVVRYGGEEFVLVFKCSNSGDAFKRIDDLRVRISELRWDEFPELQVTISGGLARYAAGDNLMETLDLVDETLYEAKNAGRNQILME